MANKLIRIICMVKEKRVRRRRRVFRKEAVWAVARPNKCKLSKGKRDQCRWQATGAKKKTVVVSFGRRSPFRRRSFIVRGVAKSGPIRRTAAKRSYKYSVWVGSKQALDPQVIIGR